jgi:hypothetical protein
MRWNSSAGADPAVGRLVHQRNERGQVLLLALAPTYMGHFHMLEIHKRIVVDENQKPVAVQIPFDEFQRIEEVIENFGLAKLMVETEDDERLSGDAAKDYYESLKATDVVG